MESILLIDDSPEILCGLAELLKAEGYAIQTAPEGAAGISLLEKNRYDFILTDWRMPVADGLAVLKYAAGHSPDSICILLTGYGTIPNAVEAVKLGAFDYLTKPVRLEEILDVLRRALKFRQRQGRGSPDPGRKNPRFEHMIGESGGMRRIFVTIERVADTDSTILVLGESGTGKELIARAVHSQSYRRENPFVPVNCAAIPGELLESELFGHEKGAFTNAIRTRIGRFELAHGGTVFLDEIGDMSPNLQSKLLRVLQERQFERVGGMRPIRTDIRVIAATHQDLKRQVEKGAFRQDLYYRLNVIPIEVPPLRERKSDIPLLVEHFLEHFKRSKRRPVVGIDPEVLDRFQEYAWPGNVRELENIIERLVILSNHEIISPADLPEKFQGMTAPGELPAVEIPEGGISLDSALHDFERRLILQALNKTGWIKNRAAQLLNLNRTTLIEKIKRQNLQRPP